MPQLPLGNGHYVSTSPVISNQLCINWFPNTPQSDALAPANLLPTPGLRLLESVNELGQTVERGGLVFEGKPYFVIGNKFFRIDQTLTLTEPTYNAVELGDIVGDEHISIAKSNGEICIVVPGVAGYIYSIKDGLQQIDDNDFLSDAKVVVFMNARFIFATDKQLFASGINQGLKYNALDRATSEVDPDNIVGLHVFKNELYVLGTDVTEVFRDVANPIGFPLQRIEGFIIDKGLVSQFAVIDYEDSFVFMGSGKNEQIAIWRVSGNKPEKISTTAIDTDINKQTGTAQSLAVAQSYAQEGIYFALFTIGGETIVFDSPASVIEERLVWHKRQSIVNGNIGSWRAHTILEAFGLLVVGDTNNGNIGSLETDTFEEYGVRIDRTWSSAPIAKEDMSPIFISKVTATVETGFSSPEANLRLALSDNAGITYGNEISRSIGTSGNFQTMLIWQRLGRVERYVQFRLSFSGNNRCVIARLDAEFQ